MINEGTKLNDLPSGLPTLTVGHDFDASQLSKFLEFTREPLFIDVVGKMTYEQIFLQLIIKIYVSLGFLCSRCSIGFCFALLGSGSLFFFTIFLLG